MQFSIEIQKKSNLLYIIYNSKYAGGRTPIRNIIELVMEIEDLFGKGSFCLYEGKGDRYPKAISPYDERCKKHVGLSHFVNALKTDFIEQVRKAAIEVWGNCPELEIGWLENQCISYVEDLD